MAVTLDEITDANREAVLALRVAAGQGKFVASVPKSLADADRYPQASPWYSAIADDGEPVGFVMVSWNPPPQSAGELNPAGEVVLRLPLSPVRD